MNLNKNNQSKNKVLIRKSSLARKKYIRQGLDQQESQQLKSENQFRITNRKINITSNNNHNTQEQNTILNQNQISTTVQGNGQEQLSQLRLQQGSRFQMRQIGTKNHVNQINGISGKQTSLRQASLVKANTKNQLNENNLNTKRQIILKKASNQNPHPHNLTLGKKTQNIEQDQQFFEEQKVQQKEHQQAYNPGNILNQISQQNGNIETQKVQRIKINDKKIDQNFQLQKKQSQTSTSTQPRVSLRSSQINQNQNNFRINKKRESTKQMLDREKREKEEQELKELKEAEKQRQEAQEAEEKRKIQAELQRKLEIQRKIKEEKEAELKKALEEQKREEEKKKQLQREKEEAEKKLREAEEKKRQLERQQRLQQIIRDRERQEQQETWQQNLLNQRRQYQSREERKQNEGEEEEEEEQKSNNNIQNPPQTIFSRQVERFRNRQQVLQQQQRTLENIERLNRERDQLISQQLNRNQEINQLHQDISNSRNQLLNREINDNEEENNVYSRGRSTNPVRQPARVQVRMTSQENRNNNNIQQQLREDSIESDSDNRDDSSNNNGETEAQRRERLQGDTGFQIRLRQLMVQGLRNVLDMSSQLGIGSGDSQPLRRELEQLNDNPFREPDNQSNYQFIRVERRNGENNRPSIGVYLSRNPGTNFTNVAQALTDIQRMIFQIRVLGQFSEGPQGLTERQINLIPEIKYKKTEQDTTCSICLEEQESDQMCKVLTCLHRFHPSCINDWLKSKPTCPNCKADQKKFFEGDDDNEKQEV